MRGRSIRWVSSLINEPKIGRSRSVPHHIEQDHGPQRRANMRRVSDIPTDKKALTMGSGRRNQLAGQIAEHLVVAELGRLGLAATGFSGNIPTFDVLAVDENCRVVPIQVKASNGDSWP